MLLFLGRRLLEALAIFIAVTTVCFTLMYLRGGEAIATNLLPLGAEPEQVRQLAEKLGLLRPLPLQYLDWLAHAVTGDLGTSYASSQEVTEGLALRIPATLSVVVVSLVFTVLLSVLLGVGAAIRGGVIDRMLQALSVTLQAIPAYWLALVFVIVFSLTLKLFPATGYVPITQSFGGWLASIFLPSMALALGNVAAVGTQIRGAMIDVLRQDFIRTLRSRGISGRAVVLRHALRNAAAPGLTILSLQVIGTLSGAVIVERIYALPGIGNLAIQSGLRGDIPFVLGVVTFMVIVVVVVNLLVELLNGFLNPKARVAT
jgi:peptide/nickel transport system permease protein